MVYSTISRIHIEVRACSSYMFWCFWLAFELGRGGCAPPLSDPEYGYTYNQARSKKGPNDRAANAVCVLHVRSFFLFFSSGTTRLRSCCGCFRSSSGARGFNARCRSFSFRDRSRGRRCAGLWGVRVLLRKELIQSATVIFLPSATQRIQVCRKITKPPTLMS